ncbi:unnamed protein product [Amaranthus hypochondriacus]
MLVFRDSCFHVYNFLKIHFVQFSCCWSYFLILTIHLLKDKQGLGLGEFVSCILFIFDPIIWLYCIEILHNYACFIWNFTLGLLFCCFVAFQVKLIKLSTNQALLKHTLLTRFRNLKETRPKGAKVDYSKPSRLQLGRAKLVRA